MMKIEICKTPVVSIVAAIGLLVCGCSSEPAAQNDVRQPAEVATETAERSIEPAVPANTQPLPSANAPIEQAILTPVDTELGPPIRLEAAGEPIDIGKLSDYAHAGPAIGDVDGDGDQDLLVGDFPGNFWFFENTNDDSEPVYSEGVQWEAGGEAAKTPVY